MSAGPRGRFARYAVHGGCFAVHGGDPRSRPKLFKPNSRGELSVFGIDNLTGPAIRRMGLDVVRRRADAKRLYGWAWVEETAVQNPGLRVVRDDMPPRHANMVGWPDNADDRRAVVVNLARASRAVVLDPPVPAATGNGR